MDSLTTKRLKVEFQGGEPLLRLDLLEGDRAFCRQRFEHAECVVCTNLQLLGPAEWDFISAVDTHVSTSLDADREIHKHQRTVTDVRTEEFFQNLRRVTSELGSSKLSALPTLDIRNLPEPVSVIASFTSHGMRSIFFEARKLSRIREEAVSGAEEREKVERLSFVFIDAVVEYNWTALEPIEEYYLVHCLRRVLRAGHNRHSDLRNPNILGDSYLVIDHDGVFHPTDEARMVSRIGQIDLSMGNLRTGLDRSLLTALNQAYCGVDLVDDLSRYGRIDLPKNLTDFCQRHTHIFDKVFELIYSEDPKVQKSVAIWAGMPEFDTALAKVHS